MLLLGSLADANFFSLHFELILVLIVRHCFSSSTAESTGNLVNSKTEKLKNIEEHINQGHLRNFNLHVQVKLTIRRVKAGKL